MAISVENKTFVNILLEDGTDDFGNYKYVILPMPEINPETFDTQKFFNICGGLAPCLNKTIGKLHKVEGKKIFVLGA